MRILRFFATCLVILLVLAGLFVAAIFSPVVQTWWVQRELNRLPGMQASVESVWAGLHRVEITNLRLERDGIVLIVPELEASLPMKTAWWDHRLVVSSLVAKGWTLDQSRAGLAGSSDPGVAKNDDSASPAEARTLPATARGPGPAPAFRGVLAGVRFPPGATFDGVQLEGSVVIIPPGATEPAHLHVILIGGGLAAGRTARFSLDANGSAANQTLRWQTSAAHGDLRVTTSPAHAITQLEFQGSVSSEDQSLPKGFSLLAAISAAGDGSRETYRVELAREARTVAAVTGQYEPGTGRFDGTWTLAANADEVAAFLPGQTRPRIAAQGDGRFETDPTLTNLGLSGTLHGTADRWADLGEAFGNIAPVTFETGFAIARRTRSVRVDRWDLTMRAGSAVTEIHTRQSADIDTTTGHLTAADPKAEWVAGTCRAVPLAWLPALGNGLAVSGGEMDGEFGLEATAAGFRLTTPKAFAARNTEVQLHGRPLLQGVTLSAALTGEYAREKGLELRLSPLTADSVGGRLATLTGTLHPIMQRGQTLTFSGNATVDLDVFAAQPGRARLPWIRGRSVTAEISATLGSAAELTAKVEALGHDRSRALSGTIGATLDDNQAASFRIPLTIVMHGKQSDVSVDGTWARRSTGQQIDVTVSSHQATLDALRLLAMSVPTADGVSLERLLETAARPTGGAAGAVAPTAVTETQSARRPRPFWGDVAGRLRIELNQLEIGSHTFHAVAGTVGFAPEGLQLNGGRAAFSPISTEKSKRGESTELPLEPNSVLSAEGRLGFDPQSASPYRLSATAGADVVDAPRLFGRAPAGHEPMIEGQFAVAATLSAEGPALPELLARRETKVKLTSTGGAVRILRTSVAEALPDAPTPVADTAAKVGSAVGWLFGVSKDAMLVQNRLPRQTEAVLNFTYQTRELPYTRCVIDATVRPTGVIDVTALDVEGANQRFTGTGQIAPAAGQPLSRRPLHLDLQLFVRGASADQLATAGLLSGEKVDGFSKVRVPLHFGGTLEQLDRTQWRDVLVQAATPPQGGKR